MTERPHKSTTHEEMFFHVIGDSQVAPYRGVTVFFRKEADGYWYASAAYCSARDQFNRRVGRSQSRRRYMQGKGVINPLWRPGVNSEMMIVGRDKPTYEIAKGVALGLMPIRN